LNHRVYESSFVEVNIMSQAIQMVVTILCSIIASSGFWTYIMKKHDKNDASKKMILGLGHNQIMSLGMEYIKRGSITQNEYENLQKYLYAPYKEMGGNGSAERIMREVDRLQIVPDSYVSDR